MGILRTAVTLHSREIYQESGQWVCKLDQRVQRRWMTVAKHAAAWVWIVRFTSFHRIHQGNQIVGWVSPTVSRMTQQAITSAELVRPRPNPGTSWCSCQGISLLPWTISRSLTANIWRLPCNLCKFFISAGNERLQRRVSAITFSDDLCFV